MENLPHLFCNFRYQLILLWTIDFDNIFQRNNKMFLKIMKQRFGSFIFGMWRLLFLPLLLFILSNLLKTYRCRIMLIFEKIMLPFIKKKLCDVICRFCIMYVLNFLRGLLIVRFWLVKENFVPFLHVDSLWIKR